MDYGNGLVKSLSTLGEYDIPISEIPMSSSSFVPNTHVKTVQFSPTYGNTSAGELSIHEASSSSCFLTTAISQLQIWNVEQPSLPLMRNNPSELPLTTASWSPTHPHSLIACGGEDKAINIIDIRVPPSTSEEQQQSVWRTENAHDRSIRDVQFNPFIPYWLASAGI
ncbi:hypothetical protein BDF20DRAFT_433283 [Mycotypha africana]|uniref:uncharacterized protein n=1 Tax=Mycotypha africana TaxID=64632 RepID=UPI00230136FF|nr:uncharacterized protein BDF20DRAFT_433283 [Mycotypha africana]KAI8981857.1 hypothetical protein BDF20DRAFT_433283 [Mycotypha africana]